MTDVSLLDIQGARPEKPSKYTSLATIKWIGGLQTQRSPFMSVDTRYNSRYLGGKPDALLAGSNVELSNRLTLQRRPGLLQYGAASIPPADFFYSYQQATTANFVSLVDPNFITYPQANLQLIVDTATNGSLVAPGNIYNYSPVIAGILLNKAPLSQQSSLYTVVNTMYIGDGVDLYKMVGSNLLTWSNTILSSSGSNIIQLAMYSFTTTENPLSDGGVFTAAGSALPLPKVPSSGICEPVATSTFYAAFHTAMAWPSNQYSAVIIQTLTGSGAITGPIIRQSQSAATFTCYQLPLVPGSSQTQTLYATVLGTSFALGSFTATVAINDSWRLQAIGNVLTVYQNGNLLLTVTDNTYNITTGVPGFLMRNNTAIADTQIQNWSAGSANNSFTAGWTASHAYFTTGQTDPTGGTQATKISWTTTGGTAQIVNGPVNPNYTPVSSNTFTFSVWLKAASAQSVTLELNDMSSTIAFQTFALTTSWALYQITGTMLNTSTSLAVVVAAPTTTADTFIYGSQLEVGGPATPTVITQNQPLGIYLWGIQAPLIAPTVTTTKQTGSTSQPWQPNHAYSQTSFSLSQVYASVGGNATYQGVFVGNLVGRYFAISGFTNSSNNSVPPGFICTANTSTTLTVNNPAAIPETTSASAILLDTIVDSNGNLEVAYTPGTSGGSEPTWSVVQGQSTFDGLQNVIVQTVTSTAGTVGSGTTASVTFPTNVTASNQLLVAVYVSHPQSIGITDTAGDSFGSSLKTVSSGQFTMYLYFVQSAVGGATTINVTGGGNTGTYIAAAELTNFTGKDSGVNAFKSNAVAQSNSGFFTTGGVTTTNATDLIVSIASFEVSASQGAGAEIGTPPATYSPITSDTAVSFASNTGIFNMTMAFTSVTATGLYNPDWSIASPTNKSQNVGITGAFTTAVGTLIWYNVGQTPTTGLSPKTGYQYYYSFVNIYTGHRSNVSPISLSTGVQTGVGFNVSGLGCPIPQSGTGASTGNGDPQVTAIEVYRNTDGGGFWYQVPPSLMTNTSGIITVNGVQYLANPGTATASGTWSFTDTVPDTSLNTQIFAPIAFLNTPPPAGLTNLEFFDGRLWGSVGNILYYATAADNATLINVLQNGVSAESWEPTNFIPFNSPIVRSVSTGVGLIVYTTTDTWVIEGNNLANYNPVKVLTGVGLGTYNGICIDGSTMMLYTRDRQCLMFNVSSGAAEIGFLIGDLIESSIDPTECYLARHIKGSQDNAFYLADGETGWFRLNPNQYGASASGEQTPIWSPFATIALGGGCGAIASIEVTPGVKQMLMTQATGLGPVFNRDINTFMDNNATYPWNATIGSLMLALPGKLAEIESITTEMTAATSNQCTVAVLIDEIAPSAEVPFEILTYSTPDPPQLASSDPSVSVLSNRFYLSPGSVPPIGRHCQIQISGAAAATQDELLALTVRGAIVEEQS